MIDASFSPVSRCRNSFVSANQAAYRRKMGQNIVSADDADFQSGASGLAKNRGARIGTSAGIEPAGVGDDAKFTPLAPERRAI